MTMSSIFLHVYFLMLLLLLLFMMPEDKMKGRR